MARKRAKIPSALWFRSREPIEQAPPAGLKHHVGHCEGRLDEDTHLAAEQRPGLHACLVP